MGDQIDKKKTKLTNKSSSMLKNSRVWKQHNDIKIIGQQLVM